jgi:uncharacterized protein (TIGR02246 family)
MMADEVEGEREMPDALTEAKAAEMAAQIEQAWIAHTLSGDKVAMAALFADDVVFLGSHPEIYVGQQGLSRYLASTGASPGMSIAFTDRQVRVLGPNALATTSYVHFKTPATEFRWAITWVMAREPQGWKIVQHHASPRIEP